MQGADSLGSFRWLDSIAIAVITTSIASLTLLVLELFSPKHALLLGASLAITVSYVTRIRLATSEKPSQSIILLPLMAVVVFAALFRVEPYPWINGGQDQGVYVSMSAHFQHGGELFIKDSVLAQIADSDLRNVYKSNRMQGVFHPGVYYGGEKDYVFQFYHLHPLWMSIFADLFGDDNRGYALTFFSLVSIIFLSLLSYELSQSRLAALSVALLLATNPLHAFFSKWPATEIVALAFSSMAFYYLARAYRVAKQGGLYRALLMISGAALGMLFFVRISGFLYLPPLALLFMTGIWLRQKEEGTFGFDLAIYASICVILYCASVYYGLNFSPNYSADIYHITFGKLEGLHWSFVMAALFSLMLLSMLLWVALVRQKAVARTLQPIMQPTFIARIALLIVFGALTYSLYKIYLLGFTDTYADHPWLDKRWGLSGSGLLAVTRSSALNWFAYSSPPLVGLGVWAMFRREVDYRVSLLLIVALISLCAVVLRSTTLALPYQYYYSRYLLTEAVPYVLVAFTVSTVGCGDRRWRNIGLVVVLTSIAWFSFFTIKQLGAEEGVIPRQALKELAGHVDKEDVLLIEPAGWSIPRFGVETPLRFYFGLNTFALGEDEREAHLREISKTFRRVWLLSPRQIDDERYSLHLRIRHHDKVMQRVGHIPLEVVDNFWNQELYLYGLKSRGWPGGGQMRFETGTETYLVSVDSPEILLLLGDGWYDLESEHVWSTSGAEFILDARHFSSGALPQTVILGLAAYGSSQERPVTVQTTICDSISGQKVITGGRFELRLDVPEENRLNHCVIKLSVDPAISPRALGRSGDDRVLGAALYYFSFE